MSPTPTPSPTPAPSPIPWVGDDAYYQQVPDAIPLAPGHPCINTGSARCILDHQQQTADELNAQSTLTPAESARFDQLMDGQPSNAAPVAGAILGVLVLAAAVVAFIRRRRNRGTSPAPAEATP